MAMTATLSATQSQVVAGRLDNVDLLLTVSNSAGVPVNVTSLVPYVSPTTTRLTSVAAAVQPIVIMTGAGSPLFVGAKNNSVPAAGSVVYPFSVDIDAPATTSVYFNTQYLRTNSTPYLVGHAFQVVANDNRTHLYLCTTAGSTAAAQGVLYPGVGGEVITDGSAVLKEQGIISALYDIGCVCYSDDGSLFLPAVVQVNATMPPV